MKHLLLALLLGAASATGFAPLGLWPLTIAAYALLIAMTISRQRLRSAFATGWAFGVGQFMVGLNWIATAFTYQAAMPAWLGWIAVVLLSLYLAVYPALATAIAWRFGKAMPLTFVLFFAAAWIVTEYLRAFVFTGFAWNPLSAIAIAHIGSGDVANGLASSARWIGTYGVSGLIVLLAGAFYLGWQRRWTAALGIGALPVAASIAGVIAVSSIATVDPDASAIRVIQPNINQNEKWDADLALRNFNRLVERTGETGDEPRLIFWPEAAVPEFIEDDPMARARISSLLGEEDLLLLGASKLIWENIENGRRRTIGARNAFYVMDANGDLLARYDKAHLVPYGEYLPMRPVLESIGLSRLAPGDLDFWPGPGPQTLELPGFGTVGGQICYEMVFSGEVVERANRPDFLFNPSNDAWFGAWGPPQHLAQARLRAIEEAMPIIRSTPTGVSAIIDARGVVADHIPYHQAGTIDARLPAPAPPTLFSRFGNILPMIFAAMLIGISLLLGWRERRRG
ncbi:MAG: apolipoprotein N-acyltransferase [Parasphingopyxis sp.]|uniref:apolipoprotein N-acyltransferase n=1 Tax=Parasphingopyxis sp. TaxID=1920299 RepID=UPI0032EC0DC5